MFYRDAMNGIFFFGGIYAAGVLEHEYSATRYFRNFGGCYWYNRCLLGWCFGQQIWLQILHQLYAWRSRYCDLVIFGLSRSEFYGITVRSKVVHTRYNFLYSRRLTWICKWPNTICFAYIISFLS